MESNILSEKELTFQPNKKNMAVSLDKVQNHAILQSEVRFYFVQMLLRLPVLAGQARELRRNPCEAERETNSAKQDVLSKSRFTR